MPISFKEDLDAVDHVLLGFAATLPDELGLKTQAAKECLRVALANIRLIDRKQLDYGPNNIAAAGAYGCAVRANDKTFRLLHLYSHGGRRPKARNENIIDSFRDFSNYGNIALVVDLGRWPKD